MKFLFYYILNICHVKGRCTVSAVALAKVDCNAPTAETLFKYEIFITLKGEVLVN